MRIVKSVLFALAGGVVLAVLVFAAGFLLAALLGPEAQSALGVLVPLVAVPVAFLAGAALGARKGWRSA